MPKLTIVITEKTEQISDNQNLSGYQIETEFETEGVEFSPLSEAGKLIYQVINLTLSLFYGGSPIASHEVKDNSQFSLDQAMAEQITKLDNFPTEIP